MAAALALHRFGLGPKPGSIAAIAADPIGALLAELDNPEAGRISVALPSSAAAARAFFEFQADRRAQQKLALRPHPAEMAGGPPPHPAPAVAVPPPGPGRQQPPLPQRLLLQEAEARFA